MTAYQGVRGNALFIVLICVALLAALTYAVTRMDGQQTGFQGKVQMDDQVGRLIAQGGMLEGAVQQMVVNGGDPALLPTADADFGLNVVTPGGAGWDAPPSEYKIYHPYGGGVKYIGQTGTGSALSATENLANNFKISKGSKVEGVGEADVLGDILFTAQVASEEACKRINAIMLGTAAPGTLPDLADVDFTALVVNGTDTAVTGANCSGCVNRARLCISNTSGNAWGYYQALLPQ